jgi:hypothetical protein
MLSYEKYFICVKAKYCITKLSFADKNEQCFFNDRQLIFNRNGKVSKALELRA